MAPGARFGMKSRSNRFVTIDSVEGKEMLTLLTVRSKTGIHLKRGESLGGMFLLSGGKGGDNIDI